MIAKLVKVDRLQFFLLRSIGFYSLPSSNPLEPFELVSAQFETPDFDYDYDRIHYFYVHHVQEWLGQEISDHPQYCLADKPAVLGLCELVFGRAFD